MDPGGSASTAEDLDTVWQKDVHTVGKATCPQCGSLRSYGTAGLVNLVKTHLDTLKCQAAAAKRDKQPRKNGSLKTFFKEKAARFLSPTVRAPSPILGDRPSSEHKANSETSLRPPVAPMFPSPVPSSRLIQLLDQLRAKVELIPSTVPIADASNPLSEFSGEPAGYVPERTPPDELWEQLSSNFHRAFDYGMGLEGRIRMVQRGPHGLDGTLRFLDYFIRERGLAGGMVELKIEQLTEAVQSVLRDMGITTPGTSAAPVDSGPGTRVVIDVDAYMDVDAEITETKSVDIPPEPKKSLPCGGFIFPFSGAGKTASSDYPYGLHDTITLPWTYSSSGILDRAKDGVSENANYAYHLISGLIQLIGRKNKRIEELRLRGLNAAKRIAAQARSLTDHKRFVRAIGSGKVEHVDRLVRVQLSRKQGVRGIVSTYDKAAQGVYHPKSYTEDDLRGVLLWKLAGNRVADFAHRALGLPSRTTLRKRTTVPPTVPSAGKPQASEVAQNITACFEGIADVLAAKKPKHAVLMYDEIATEKRVRWDPKTNNFLGVCREHANKVSLQFNGEQDLEELFRAKEEGKVHFAGEATVAAIGMLSDETRLYAARPVLISGDCKKESGVEHLHNILNPTIDGMNSKRDLTGLRIVSLASDGETRRGKAFVDKTFIRQLSPDSNIYHLLKDLPFMDFYVGEDDLTGDKDYKHVFKRGRNRLLRSGGFKVFGILINPTIIRIHLQSAGLSTQHINSVLNPEDKQDVKLAFQLLKDIWSLPPAREDARPGFISVREALRTIGALFYHLLFPYLCVDLTLSEQLEHLSAAAHLNLILFRDSQKEALPTLLFTDIMIMIKNAYFCVAKAKVDDPTGNFWLILLGTDRLEELFGILRTMIGNDRNLDVLQLVERITGTTEVANIFAMYPHWDRAPRRLQLPTMARDSSVLPDRADHIKPPSWRGNTALANVTPLTCWLRGRRTIEKECPSLAKYFRALDEAYNISILSPLGELIVNKDLDPDDNEDDERTESAVKSSVSPDLEDAAADEEVFNDQVPTFANFITVQDKPLRKTRALALMQKFGYKAGSTDRLKRVADVQRYSAKSDEPSAIIESDAPYILVSEPIATLVPCEDKLFVCIGEVTDIRLDSKSVEQLSIDVLQERKVTVHFQILCLVPATTEDDPDSKHDWRSSGVLRNVLATPGRLVLPVDPSLSTRIAGKPYYLFESSVLRAFGAQLLDEVTLHLNKNIPKFTPTSSFPYRESSVWRYNLKYHLMRSHPLTPMGRHKDLWELSDSESTSMFAVWEKAKEPRKKKTAAKGKATLATSAAHSSRLALV
ncbi:hypothetical protein FB451DRAFT_1465917 [Mycena latifolia]|nr:hypothetical protein FB451DRAFT_1465917 [Mycena latifolia]